MRRPPPTTGSTEAGVGFPAPWPVSKAGTLGWVKTDIEETTDEH